MSRNIFEKVASWIHRLFAKIPRELKEVTALALQITTGLRNALDHPVADLFTAIIPGDWDQQTKDKALSVLDKIIPALLGINECDKGNYPCLFRHLLSVLQGRSEKDRHATLLALAQLFVSVWDGNRLKESQYDAVVQVAYTGSK